MGGLEVDWRSFRDAHLSISALSGHEIHSELKLLVYSLDIVQAD